MSVDLEALMSMDPYELRAELATAKKLLKSEKAKVAKLIESPKKQRTCLKSDPLPCTICQDIDAVLKAVTT